MTDEPIDTPEPAQPSRIKRLKSRFAAWWSAWKWVAILALLLGSSLYLNLRQYGTIRTAEADCKTNMVEAAKLAIEQERARAAKAEEQAAKIAKRSKSEARNASNKAEENTNARDHRIQATRTTGACVMPRGLPPLSDAVDAANAAGRD